MRMISKRIAQRRNRVSQFRLATRHHGEQAYFGGTVSSWIGRQQMKSHRGSTSNGALSWIVSLAQHFSIC